MEPSHSLTPELVLRLYRSSGRPDRGLSSLIADTFAVSATSREACSHLLHFFETTWECDVSYQDLFFVHSRWEGQRLWSQLQERFLDLEPRKIFSEVQGMPPSAHWGLVEEICEASRRRAPFDPDTALDMANVATRIARSLQPESLTPDSKQELIALTYAIRANALRMKDDLPQAEDAMTRASALLSGQQGFPLGHMPRFLSLRASLEMGKEEHSRALSSLTSALTYSMDDRLRSRILVQRSLVYIYLGSHQAALPDLVKSTDTIDRHSYPRDWWCAMQNRLLVATNLELWDDAAALLQDVSKLVEDLDSPVDKLLVRWIEARLSVGKEEYLAAEETFTAVRQGFLDRDLSYSAAAVTLELAQLLFQQGRLEEVKRYAVETIAEFERQGVEAELIGALALLEQAVLGQFLTVDILTDIRRRIERRAAGVQKEIW
jgi:tetratricopeptide (TPR) repeat protein